MTVKVRISDINAAGTAVHGKLDLAFLNKRMTEGAHKSEIVFLDAPRCELTVVGTPQGAEARGSVKTRYRQPCSRCLKEVTLDLEREARFILKPKSSIREGVIPENDVYVIYFEGDVIDFEDALQETLILGLSPYLLPERKPDGTCALCGEKVQSEFTFGAESSEGKTKLAALLQKAAEKKAH